MSFHVSQLQEGRFYRMRFKRQSGNYRWYECECVVQYIDRLQDRFGRDDLMVSGRPLFGTATVAADHVIEVEEIPEGEFFPTRVRQFPGAVDPPQSERTLW